MHAALGDASSFEEAVRRYFEDATDSELDDMLGIAEPLVAWRKREFESGQWVRATRMTQADAVHSAFGVSGAHTGSLSGASHRRLLFVDAFLRAATLHGEGVDPATLRMADMRNLRVHAHLQRRGGARNGADKTDLDAFEQLLSTVTTDGRITLDDLLDVVSSIDALRSNFEAIVRIGISHRQGLKNGYWRAANAPSAHSPRRPKPHRVHTARR